MTAIHILFLLGNDHQIYRVVWEDLYYGMRTVKDVQAMYISASHMVDSLRKNYPQ